MVYRQNHDPDKYSSITLCTLQMKHYEYFSSLNAVKFVLLDLKLQQSRCFLLLYRKNNSNVSQYLEGLEYVLNNYIINIVLGDFNINCFNETHSH